MKTICEAAIEFEKKEGEIIYDKHLYHNPDCNLCIESFKAGVEFAQRWIPIEDELPVKTSHGFSYLVFTKNSFGDILLERFDFEYNHFTAVRHDSLVKGDGQVSHWRPIELK